MLSDLKPTYYTARRTTNPCISWCKAGLARRTAIRDPAATILNSAGCSSTEAFHCQQISQQACNRKICNDKNDTSYNYAKLLKQGYRYHRLRKAFSKFYRRHYELISKFNVGLKSLLHQGLSEPEFYGDSIQI